jgi:hypothetical protein
MEILPKIFIGSSSEGLKIAQNIEKKLGDFAKCTIWPNAFEFGKSNFDNLAEQIAFYDYAILIATGDDTIVSRGKRQKGGRDNILFEFGLFTGGLGKSRVFYIMEQDTKLPSDLLGITLPYIPKSTADNFYDILDKNVDLIKNSIINKEKTFDLGFLPSTALAYGYFNNFVERTVQRLLEDKNDEKVFHLTNGKDFKISNLKFTILLPNDLSDDMFKKVTAKRLKGGWQKLKVDPKDVRDYDFSIDVSKAEDGELHLVDIPFTLNALNMSIELYSKKQHLGKTIKEEILEAHEIRNFKRTLEYLINKSSIARDIVNIEIVEI